MGKINNKERKDRFAEGLMSGMEKLIKITRNAENDYIKNEDMIEALSVLTCDIENPVWKNKVREILYRFDDTEDFFEAVVNADTLYNRIARSSAKLWLHNQPERVGKFCAFIYLSRGIKGSNAIDGITMIGIMLPWMAKLELINSNISPIVALAPNDLSNSLYLSVLEKFRSLNFSTLHKVLDTESVEEAIEIVEKEVESPLDQAALMSILVFTDLLLKAEKEEDLEL